MTSPIPRVLFAALLSLAAANAWGACVEPRRDVINDVGFFAVPDVAGMDESEAVACLKRYGFATERGGVEDSTLAANLVTRTDPAAGTGVSAREVKVTYWQASGGNVVPRLVGRPRDEAIGAIQAAGFVLGEDLTQPNAAPAGEVLAQAPDPDVVRRLGAPISITVATPLPEAPPPPPVIEPAPTPSTDPDAGTNANTQAGTAGAPVPAAPSTAGAPDDPVVGPVDKGKQTSGDQGGDADLGKTPPEKWVAVPDLTSRSVAEATTLLRANKLVAVRGGTVYWFRDDGLVSSQRPAAGELVREGGTVSFVVVRARPVQLALTIALALILLATLWWTRLRPWPVRWPPAVIVRGRLDTADTNLPPSTPLAGDAPSVSFDSRLEADEPQFSDLVVTGTEECDDRDP